MQSLLSMLSKRVRVWGQWPACAALVGSERRAMSQLLSVEPKLHKHRKRSTFAKQSERGSDRLCSQCAPHSWPPSRPAVPSVPAVPQETPSTHYWLTSTLNNCYSTDWLLLSLTPLWSSLRLCMHWMSHSIAQYCSVSLSTVQYRSGTTAHKSHYQPLYLILYQYTLYVYYWVRYPGVCFTRDERRCPLRRVVHRNTINNR